MKIKLTFNAFDRKHERFFFLLSNDVSWAGGCESSSRISAESNLNLNVYKCERKFGRKYENLFYNN